MASNPAAPPRISRFIIGNQAYPRETAPQSSLPAALRRYARALVNGLPWPRRRRRGTRDSQETEHAPSPTAVSPR